MEKLLSGDSPPWTKSFFNVIVSQNRIPYPKITSKLLSSQRYAAVKCILFELGLGFPRGSNLSKE